jgi:Ca-activated chloride channel family protein
LQLSSLAGFNPVGKSVRVVLRHIPFALRTLALGFAIFVLARPQSSSTLQNVTSEGIDIVLALDISGSMLARDFEPDRLEAAKDIGIKFISSRRTDRMGLVVFSGESFTLCPLTSDHVALINMFKDVKMGLLEDGTAIGSGLATAISRLKDSDAISKVVILLTDGVNNMGEIAPITAAEIAKTFGVRVYTVGVGSRGMAPYPYQTPFGVRYQNVEVQIDEDVLKQIAELTGGQYFRATDNKTLEEVYLEIDKLERSKVEVTEYSRRQEEYRMYALVVLGLLLMEILLRTTIFRTIP